MDQFFDPIPYSGSSDLGTEGLTSSEETQAACQLSYLPPSPPQQHQQPQRPLAQAEIPEQPANQTLGPPWSTLVPRDTIGPHNGPAPWETVSLPQLDMQQWQPPPSVPQYGALGVLGGPQLFTPPPLQRELLAGSSTDNTAQLTVLSPSPALTLWGQEHALALTDPAVPFDYPAFYHQGQVTDNNFPAPKPAQYLAAPVVVEQQQPPPPSGTGMAAGSRRRAALANTRAERRCLVCIYKCKQKEELRRHMDSVHKGIRRHRCDVCDVSVNDPSSLSKHKKSAGHLQKSGQAGQAARPAQRYACRACQGAGKKSQVFARSDHLKRHLKSCPNCTLLEDGLRPGSRRGPGGWLMASCKRAMTMSLWRRSCRRMRRKKRRNWRMDWRMG